MSDASNTHLRKLVTVRWGFEIAVIEAPGRIWIGLFGKHSWGGVLQFWSEKPAPTGAVESAESVFNHLEALVQQSESRDAVDQNCRFWPTGWEFWGGGVPNPIADYMHHYFEDQKAELLN